MQRMVAAAAVVVCGASSPVFAQEDGAPLEGRALALRNCMECHAVLRGEVRSPNAAAPPFQAVARVPGMTAAALHVALTTSHRTMPNIILDAEERRNIAAYILSLK